MQMLRATSQIKLKVLCCFVCISDQQPEAPAAAHTAHINSSSKQQTANIRAAFGTYFLFLRV
jgi:hypothetical protein